MVGTGAEALRAALSSALPLLVVRRPGALAGRASPPGCARLPSRLTSTLSKNAAPERSSAVSSEASASSDAEPRVATGRARPGRRVRGFGGSPGLSSDGQLAVCCVRSGGAASSERRSAERSGRSPEGRDARRVASLCSALLLSNGPGGRAPPAMKRQSVAQRAVCALEALLTAAPRDRPSARRGLRSWLRGSPPTALPGSTRDGTNR